MKISASVLAPVLLALIAWAACVQAADEAKPALKGQAMLYKHGDLELEGYLSRGDDAPGARPGVLVVPDWMGMSDHYRGVADQLAAMGYIAFCVDMYGKDVRPTTREEAGANAGKLKGDRKLMQGRIDAARQVLLRQKDVDPKRIAAIGYCFGGTTVLELARSGADVAGVVSFHGGLGTPTPNGKNIKAKVLVLHGADDPHVPPEEVAAFMREMRDGNVDWQFIHYADAVHSFTKVSAGNDKTKGSAYNEHAAKRSWAAMKTFFAEIFAK